MLDYLSPDSIDQLRYAIKEADGNEVFVLAQTDAKCRIVQIEVLARGSEMPFRRSFKPVVMVM